MEVISAFNSFLSQTPATIIASLLQGIAFTMAFTTAMTALLKFIQFSYASALMRSKPLQIVFVLLFLYYKASGTWHSVLVVFQYLSGGIVSLYAADCCCNIATAYAKNVFGLYWGQVVLYVNLAIVLPLFILYGRYNSTLLLVLAAEISMIALANAVRGRHIIYSAVISLTVLSIPLLRLVGPSLLKPLYLESLPIQLIPIVMMAFDAEYRESGERRGETGDSTIQMELLKSGCWFLLYAGLNGQEIHVELILGGIYLVLVAWDKDK